MVETSLELFERATRQEEAGDPAPADVLTPTPSI